MIDHLTLRVPSMESAVAPLTAALEALDIAATVVVPGLVLWAGSAAERARPRGLRRPDTGARRPLRRGGRAAGLADNGAPGPRPGYPEDYYAAFLLDDAGNNFEAVHRAGPRPPGTIDHVAIRVADAPAATAFYELIGDAAGLTVRRRGEGRTTFAIASGGAFSVIAGEPSAHLHLAFGGDEPAVRRFHADAVAAGYHNNGDPGERPDVHAGYYAAFVLDPDGNNIEVVEHHRGRALTSRSLDLARFGEV
jgi:catechol 2,3-dioxygenase-like lactoylglutathione lyase family enzyme